MNWPNFISLGRLLMVPLIVGLILNHHMKEAFWAFLVAGASDFLDGLLARVLKNRTTIGAYLDPLADKVLLVAVFISLGLRGFVPSWLVILIVFRDFMIVGGTLLLKFLEQPLRIQPLVISKVNTCVQIFLVTALLGQNALGFSMPAFNHLFFILTAGTTISSGIVYVSVWIQQTQKVDRS